MFDQFSARMLFVFALTILSSFDVGAASAENAEIEKCTCDTQRENEPNNGAWVKNASACWSTEDRGRQWCDITVQSLQGDVAHDVIVGTLLQYENDGAVLAKVLQDQFNAFAASFAAGGQIIPIDIDRAAEVIPSLLKTNERQISECVKAFRYAAFGKGGKQEEGESFHCSVGESSGWLRIELRTGEFWIAYMLAPNG